MGKIVHCLPGNSYKHRTLKELSSVNIKEILRGHMENEHSMEMAFQISGINGLFDKE